MGTNKILIYLISRLVAIQVLEKLQHYREYYAVINRWKQIDLVHMQSLFDATIYFQTIMHLWFLEVLHPHELTTTYHHKKIKRVAKCGSYISERGGVWVLAFAILSSICVRVPALVWVCAHILTRYSQRCTVLILPTIACLLI